MNVVPAPADVLPISCSLDTALPVVKPIPTASFALKYLLTFLFDLKLLVFVLSLILSFKTWILLPSVCATPGSAVLWTLIIPLLNFSNTLTVSIPWAELITILPPIETVGGLDT